MAQTNLVRFGTPGAWTPTFDDEVRAERTHAYAAATNERDPRFLRGELAPPLFAVVPVRPALVAAFDLAMPEGLPPGTPRLAGEQDMLFHQAIRAGMRVRSRAQFAGIAPKSTGVVVTTRLETRDTADDSLLVEQYSATFLPRVTHPVAEGTPVAGHPLPEGIRGRPPLARIRQQFDVDQTFRYAAAAGDPNRYHLDDAVARAGGLPGIIVHGLCTMAFLARAVAEAAADGDALRVRRLAVRFSRPVRPGQEITTLIWDGGEAGPRRRLHFETTNLDAQTVITNGYAEIEDGL